MEPITESKRLRNWTRRKINAELKVRGLRQSDLVRQTGKSQPMVSEVVAGRRKSQPIAAALAAALGLHPHDIWPRLYAPPSGEPMTEATGEPAPTALAS